MDQKKEYSWILKKVGSSLSIVSGVLLSQQFLSFIMYQQKISKLKVGVLFLGFLISHYVLYKGDSFQKLKVNHSSYTLRK